MKKLQSHPHEITEVSKFFIRVKMGNLVDMGGWGIAVQLCSTALRKRNKIEHFPNGTTLSAQVRFCSVWPLIALIMKLILSGCNRSREMLITGTRLEKQIVATSSDSRQLRVSAKDILKCSFFIILD